MTPKQEERERGRWAGYLAAAAIAGAAALAQPLLPSHLQGAQALLYPAVAISAVRWGPGPALLATLVAAAAAALLGPPGSDAWPVALFAVTGLATGAAVGLLRGRREDPAVRESEERFRAFFENTAVGAAQLDLAGRFVQVNDRYCEITGYSREELLGMAPSDLSIAEDVGRERARIERWLQGADRVYDVEKQYVRKDGEVIWVHVTSGLIRDAAGRLVRSAGVIEDVTKRKRAEEALQRYRLLADHARDIMLFVRRSDGRIVDANAAAVAAYGYGLEELRTLRIHDLRAPETLSVTEAQMAEADARGVRFETHHRRKDGSVFPVEVSAQGATLNGIRMLVSVVRDIEDRKRAEEALRASEERLRLFVEHAPAAVAMFDREMRYLAVSRRFVTDYRLEGQEIVGRSHYDVFPEIPERWKEVHRRCLAGATERSEEDSFARSDGAVEWLRWEIRPWRNASGEIGGLVLFSESITELKRMQAQLIESDRLASLGVLAAGVAHEINNPLAYVVAALDYLREELEGLGELVPPQRLGPVAQAVAEAREGAGRVHQVVRDLKTFSRVDGEVRTLVDLPRVLESSLAMAANEIRHRARLVRVFGESPPVLANEARLGQVFLNLFTNAAHAIPEGRAADHEIRVSTRAEGGGAVVEVRDSGVGIAPDVLGRIFDPFFTTKPIGEGTGLGLSICRNIVEAAGGEIRVESEPGKGTCVRVILPAAPPSSKGPEAPRRAAAPAGDGARRGHVLVVDDEPAVAGAVRRALEREHEVTVLGSAAEARTRIASGERFDAIVCDLMMPVMTGMELHAELSTIAPDQAERMVLLTGGAFTARAREFLEAVPNARVDKPFEAAELRAVVRGLVAKGTAP